MTTIKLPFKRFVRRANSGQITNTQWLAAMASSADDLKQAPWAETLTQVSKLPVNVPTTEDFSGAQFDAFRQSGNAQSGTGTQCVFVGMSIYRFAIPAAASATYINTVTFRAASDKFCVGGLKVAAILSNTATPPTDWEMLRAGGYGSTVEDSFSTRGTVSTEGVETAGILADTATTVSAASNHSGVYTIDLSDVTDGYSYLFLAVSLFDYQARRREYYVEGSGAIVGDSVQITFAADVTIADVDHDVRLPIRAVGNAKIATFSGIGGNLENNYLRMDWGCKMMLGGLSAESLASPVVTTDIVSTLSPRLYLSGLSTIMRGAIAEVYYPTSSIGGRTLWLRALSAQIGASPIRVSVIDSVTRPDESEPRTWAGTDSGCIGSIIVSGLTENQEFGIPITRDAGTNRLWVVASIANVDIVDADLSAIGFADYLGLSLTDAHISKTIYTASPTTPAQGLISFTADIEKGGMIFEAISQSLGSYGANSFAISPTGSACESGTSAGEWKRLVDDVAISPTHLLCHASTSFFMGIDEQGNILYSGDKSQLSTSIDVKSAGTDNFDCVPLLNGFVLLKNTGACVCYGSRLIGVHNAVISTWAGVYRLRSNGADVIGLTSTNTLLVSGFSATAKATLEALTGIEDVQISTSRIIVLKSDGTAQAWSISGGEIAEIILAWSTLYSVAASENAVWGVNASGVNHVSPLSIFSNFYDAGNIPSGKTPYFVVGSNDRRIAVAYITE